MYIYIYIYWQFNVHVQPAGGQCCFRKHSANRYSRSTSKECCEIHHAASHGERMIALALACMPCRMLRSWATTDRADPKVHSHRSLPLSLLKLVVACRLLVFSTRPPTPRGDRTWSTSGSSASDLLPDAGLDLRLIRLVTSSHSFSSMGVRTAQPPLKGSGTARPPASPLRLRPPMGRRLNKYVHT